MAQAIGATECQNLDSSPKRLGASKYSRFSTPVVSYPTEVPGWHRVCAHSEDLWDKDLGMSEQSKIAERMRLDWNRRVNHDYRFWMSDGHASDEEMWQTGERDLAIMTAGIEGCGEKTVLEVGCGVGRLLRAASQKFRKVIGLDVSDEAIRRASELLKDCPQVRLEVGNGVDLACITSSSIDVALSFAAITSMPTEVIAGYLHEIHRVLVPGGLVRT
ncbi:MAG: class I SAM-dependent methyltransferase [Proteobacteria bacterium]|nr:class I SAM-dependent methyltransferase [Pseudomonadota bacterium]